MFQNIKVDIVYYKTATDFEMEFNLSGCCRMRLLTDKASDRKILVNQLVRAVTRSRIIMITGSLFGEGGIIETCAKAISRPKAKINNKQFGIAEGENIEIIKDSIPLVSSDGIFGGCIIEQGPQTLILLTENKNIRKNIMQTLIHPYVKEVCAGELTEKAPETPTPASEAMEIEETPETIEAELEETAEPEISAEPEAEAQTDEQEPSEVADTIGDGESDASEINQLIIDEEESLPQVVPMEPPQINLEPEPIFATDTDANTQKQVCENVKTEAGQEEYITDDGGIKPKKRLSLNLSIIILTVLLLLVAVILCYSIFVVPNSQGVSAEKYLKETFDILFG